MNSTRRTALGYLAASTVLSVLIGCAPTSVALRAPAKDFISAEAIPPVEGWELVTRPPGATPIAQLGATDATQVVWDRPTSAKGEGFSYSVHHFQTTRQAREGYRRALRIYRIPGYTADPNPEWAYDSQDAHQYATFCGGQETTPGNCYSVGRYANYVVVVGFLPGQHVGVERLPELFGAVDRHVAAVIAGAQDK
jgi:hypothetical protein